MFIRAIRYLLRDSTATSLNVSAISTRKCKYENLMDDCLRFVKNSSMNDTYRYINMARIISNTHAHIND